MARYSTARNRCTLAVKQAKARGAQDARNLPLFFARYHQPCAKCECEYREKSLADDAMMRKWRPQEAIPSAAMYTGRSRIGSNWYDILIALRAAKTHDGKDAFAEGGSPEKPANWALDHGRYHRQGFPGNMVAQAC
jgi:hypothetical protein